MAKRQFDKMNDLARKFYARAGKEIEEGYDFSTSNHGEELAMFAYAYDAFNYFDEQERAQRIEIRDLKKQVKDLIKDLEAAKEELRVTKLDQES